MAYDSSKLFGHTFTHPPKPATVYWEPQLIRHKLSDGSLAVSNKGFILKGTLEWGPDSWLDQSDYSAIMTMYNELTGTGEFYPRPDAYSTRAFNVQITNDFNFIPHGGLLGGRQLYEGTITFESSVGEITSTTSEIF